MVQLRKVFPANANPSTLGERILWLLMANPDMDFTIKRVGEQIIIEASGDADEPA